MRWECVATSLNDGLCSTFSTASQTQDSSVELATPLCPPCWDIPKSRKPTYCVEPPRRVIDPLNHGHPPIIDMFGASGRRPCRAWQCPSFAFVAYARQGFWKNGWAQASRAKMPSGDGDSPHWLCMHKQTPCPGVETGVMERQIEPSAGFGHLQRMHMFLASSFGACERLGIHGYHC